ncbi:alcohol dehydrogenase catalytic domain-containing protein [Catellatospora aurea]|uniref:Alcohol dehydrogenase catalytic domain-containing protein n=1 Tax=Catellatospora aurea TaxID=1337874 RepID=A0ABW2HB08_9ACTN
MLVQVAGSGANPLDTKIRAGKAAHARTSLPAVLGLDLAGTLQAVGAERPVSNPVTRCTGSPAGWATCRAPWPSSPAWTPGC